MSVAAKRVDIVSVKLVRDSSVMYPQRTINNPSDVAHLIRPFLENEDREVFLVVCVDTKHQPTAINVVSIGTINSTFSHPREIFKAAILSNTSGIILAHNHPSGLPHPSRDDEAITKRIVEAGRIIGIDVLDHIIIGANNSYTSFKERGLI